MILSGVVCRVSFVVVVVVVVVVVTNRVTRQNLRSVVVIDLLFFFESCVSLTLRSIPKLPLNLAAFFYC